MKRLVIAPYSRRLGDVVKAVGVDEESLALVFTHGPLQEQFAELSNSVVAVESSDIAKAIAAASAYARDFERVRVVVSETLTPYTALASALTYIALSTLEPFSSFRLEPLAVYHMGRLIEFSGKPRLWLRGLRDLELVKALNIGCLGVREAAERCSIPIESARRRLVELGRGGLVEGFRSGRRTVYCLTDFGRMLIT
uniref:Uncharacterized protein n=1 Tax=Ignisphaera aggregans TaxID=334771 RepID=A0A7J2U5D7_9CREN